MELQCIPCPTKLGCKDPGKNPFVRLYRESPGFNGWYSVFGFNGCQDEVEAVVANLVCSGVLNLALPPWSISNRLSDDEIEGEVLRALREAAVEVEGPFHIIVC